MCVEPSATEFEARGKPGGATSATALISPLPPKTWSVSDSDLLHTKHYVAKGLAKHGDTQIWKPFNEYLKTFPG